MCDGPCRPASVTEALAMLDHALDHLAVADTASLAGFEDDGHGSARTWLKWQTRITAGAAAGAVGWTRRLSAHPAIAGALAAGDLSESWARQLCEWTGRLPEGRRDDADEILVSA